MKHSWKTLTAHLMRFFKQKMNFLYFFLNKNYHKLWLFSFLGIDLHFFFFFHCSFLNSFVCLE